VGITFSRLAFSYWIDNLGFITEGKLAATFIKPSLGVSNWPVITSSTTRQQVFWHHHHRAITLLRFLFLYLGSLKFSLQLCIHESVL
jgi:hypothetical protein